MLKRYCVRFLSACMAALGTMCVGAPALAANSSEVTMPPLIATAPPAIATTPPDIATAPPAIATAPSTDASSTVSLSDLVAVAQCLAGTRTLGSAEREHLGLPEDGDITLADLVELAQRYVDDRADDTEPAFPTPDPQFATATVTGTIASVDADENTWYIAQQDGIETGAIVSGETIIVDCTTGEPVDTSALTDGTRVTAYLALQMMPSEPARAVCYALIVNPPTVGNGNASYIYAAEVTPGQDGAVVILNENADLYVTVPSDIPISVFGEPDVSATPSDITQGTRLIAWFDVVAQSYPAQAWALRVEIVPGSTESSMP